MPERLTGAVARGMRILACRTLGLHAPGQAIKSNGLFLYGRCTVCKSIITRTGPVSWRAAREVDDDYLEEMQDV